MKIKKHENGYYYVHLWCLDGVRSLSLKTKSEKDAHRRAAESKLAALESAAKSNTLTSDTVGRILSGKKQTGTDVFAGWRGWAKIAGLSRNTVATYETYIGLFLRDTGFWLRSISGATEWHIDAFVNPVESEIVVGTRRNRLAAISSFFAFTHAKGFTIGNPAALVRVKLGGLSFEKREPRRRVPFTDQELSLLRTIEAPFWSTFILLSEHYGFRLSDVATLERACVSKPGVIIVWTQKRAKRLELPLDPRVRDHLAGLESPHPTLFFPREQALVADPKRRATLSVEFGRIVRRLGIIGKTAHNLRNTYASRRAGLGDSIDSIRAALGHESAETTRGYLNTL